ncbi:DEAD/DEAH box helicase [Streptococcus suis]|uniref:DEAD/DEAH box helicase n=1 Tax=Streptococcus suis TaxID=1307 RepID=UPI0003F5003B|nr:DEAD/DEAH box helicase [Streptococcus suis]
MTKQSIIHELNEKAISDNYLYRLLEKIQYKYGVELLSENAISLTDREFLNVLRFADILSRSNLALNRNIALKIVSTLYDFYKENVVYQLFAQNVMVKLGNFPSLTLLEKNGLQFDNREIEVDRMIKQIFQRTSVENQFFTDTQYEAFHELIDSNHYSFSAGTSFGKSFLFSEFVNWIIEEKNGSENIAFLVPTRALITQVIEDIRKTIHNEEYKIVGNPDIPALFRHNKFIFVFTPERLVSYFAESNNPNISTMIVDEAHNTISDDERSPIFYHAITLAEQKSVKLYFASPNVPNPEIFLELVGNSIEESKQITEVNVVQNKFYVDFVTRKVRCYYDFLQTKKFDEFDSKYDSLEKLIINMTQESQSIIYCNSVHNTVSRAQVFSKSVNKSRNKALIELSNYIRETIHGDYYLADLVEKGIAYHFGALPQEIRKNIEEAFKQGLIRFLFTTSTLLQGVNLPAKNLFILSDKIGKSNLKELDFWNLAGRAGRLSKELYGNLFVVRMEGTSTSHRLLEFEGLPKIESKVLSGKANFYKNIGNVLENKEMTNKSMPAKNKREIADYATILTYQRKKNVSSQLVDKFIQKNNKSGEIFKKISEIDIPRDILMVSTTIKPRYQESIYREQNSFIFKDKYDANTCWEILEMLSKKYNWNEEEDKRYLGNQKRLGYYSVIMSEWIQSKPLNLMIKSTIRYHEKNRVAIPIDNNPYNLEPFSINKANHINHVINELLKDVENIVRFKVKNYVMNYLNLTGQVEGEWRNYLEYGTNDNTVIELQKIGFDRQVSLELINYQDECFKFNSSGEIVQIDKKIILSKEISKEACHQINILL